MSEQHTTEGVIFGRNLIRQPKMLEPWGTSPVGPYHAQGLPEHHLVQADWWATERPLSFYDALTLVIELELPVRPGRIVSIVDFNEVCVFGFCSAEWLVGRQARAGWYGVEAGFRLAEMSGLISPMDLAVWETTALLTVDSKRSST